MENYLRAKETMMVAVVSVVVLGWLSLCPTVVMGGEGRPKLHRVGGSKGWNLDVNYTKWSSDERIYVGDWLYFVFDKRYYNVLEVNKTSYENCIDRDFIKNVTRGGRDVVELTEARTYYYITSGGYCFHGMRVAVDVINEAQAPASAFSHSHMKNLHSAATVYTCTWTIVVVVATLIYLNLVSVM